MISFEDLRNSLDDDQIQKLLLREPTLSALQHDLSTSHLGNGDDSARHPPHSSHHLYSQFLATQNADPTMPHSSDISLHQMFTLGKRQSSQNLFGR